MRRLLVLFACASVGLGAGVACATSDDEPGEPAPPPDGDGGLFLDTGPRADVAPDVIKEPPTCSPAGWCLTELPNDELSLIDIWPVPNGAFAIATSETVGAKILEWQGATNKWSYIDDNKQNTGYGGPQSIWAPNADEVYYASLSADFTKGIVSATVYYGRRPVPPEEAWSWKAFPAIDCHGFSLPIVWGSSRDDVHLVYCNSVYRLNDAAGDGGVDAADASPWITEYVVEGDTTNVSLRDITGTGPDDLWIVGGRTWAGWGGCGFVVRKDSAGYKLIADGVFDEMTDECSEKDGFATIHGAFQYGNQIASTNQLIGVSYVSDQISEVSKVAAKADGSFSHLSARPPAAADILLNSTWGVSENDLWFVTGRLSGGANAILRGTDVWSDGGAFNYSTVSMNGEPNPKRLTRIRGTSNTDIWAIGDQRALHKTTP